MRTQRRVAYITGSNFWGRSVRGVNYRERSAHTHTTGRPWAKYLRAKCPWVDLAADEFPGANCPGANYRYAS